MVREASKRIEIIHEMFFHNLTFFPLKQTLMSVSIQNIMIVQRMRIVSIYEALTLVRAKKVPPFLIELSISFDI